jgi:hypothetical protein
MPLKPYKTKDEVPEAQRETALALADGTFAVFEEADTSELQGVVSKERTAREAAERLAKKASDELKKLETDRKAADAGLNGEALAKIRLDVRTEVLAELAPELEKGKSALGENRALKLDAKVKALALKTGVIGEHVDAWWKLHGDKFDLMDDGTPVVKGKEGVSLEKFIGGDCKTETGYLYEGTKAAGGGAHGDGGAKPTAGATSFADLLSNPTAALQTARAAGKTE